LARLVDWTMSGGSLIGNANTIGRPLTCPPARPMIASCSLPPPPFVRAEPPRAARPSASHASAARHFRRHESPLMIEWSVGRLIGARLGWPTGLSRRWGRCLCLFRINKLSASIALASGAPRSASNSACATIGATIESYFTLERINHIGTLGRTPLGRTLRASV